MDPDKAHSLWDHFKNFMNKPFSPDMDGIDWFLFIGFLLVLLIIWNIILRHIRDAL